MGWDATTDLFASSDWGVLGPLLTLGVIAGVRLIGVIFNRQESRDKRVADKEESYNQRLDGQIRAVIKERQQCHESLAAAHDDLADCREKMAVLKAENLIQQSEKDRCQAELGRLRDALGRRKNDHGDDHAQD